MAKKVEAPLREADGWNPRSRPWFDGGDFPVIRTAYDGSRVDHVCECKDASLASQADKDSTDINIIVARHFAAGIPLPVSDGIYADVSEFGGYFDVMNHIAEFSEVFAQLPADTRVKFNNDAAVFLDFVSNPANKEEAIKMGLVTAPIVEEPPPPPPPPA